MPLVRASALRICVLLAIPAGAFAQSTRTPTVFSPSTQMGTVNVRAGLVQSDYTVKPLPLLRVVAKRTDRPDSVAIQTDLDGRASLPLRVGTYMVRAKTAQPVRGQSYAWSVRVVVRASRTETVQLTNANADSTAAAPVVVASAPVAPAEKPVVDRPAERPVENPFVVPPSSNPPRAAIPKPAPTPLPVAPAPTRSVRSALPRANTSKLILGLSLNGSSLSSDELTTATESGAGLSGQVGWGFTRNFAIVLDASAARIESVGGNFDLAHVDVAGRWHFVSRSHGFVPYVEVGYSGRAAAKSDVLLSDGMGNTYTGDMAILGGGVSFGGGMEYFIAPTWALGGAFKWTIGQFDRVRFDNVTVDGLALDATSARFNLGFSWYPMRAGH